MIDFDTARFEDAVEDGAGVGGSVHVYFKEDIRYRISANEA